MGTIGIQSRLAHEDLLELLEECWERPHSAGFGNCRDRTWIGPAASSAAPALFESHGTASRSPGAGIPQPSRCRFPASTLPGSTSEEGPYSTGAEEPYSTRKSSENRPLAHALQTSLPNLIHGVEMVTSVNASGRHKALLQHRSLFWPLTLCLGAGEDMPASGGHGSSPREGSEPDTEGTEGPLSLSASGARQGCSNRLSHSLDDACASAISRRACTSPSHPRESESHSGHEQQRVTFQEAASHVDDEQLRVSFQGAWGLQSVHGTPARRLFWLQKSPCFVLGHVVKLEDTIASVALMYGCQPGSIRRVNNMINDSEIYTRRRLLVPLGADVLSHLKNVKGLSAEPDTRPDTRREAPDPEAGPAYLSESSGQALRAWLGGRTCRVKFDVFARRDVAVVESDCGSEVSEGPGKDREPAHARVWDRRHDGDGVHVARGPADRPVGLRGERLLAEESHSTAARTEEALEESGGQGAGSGEEGMPLTKRGADVVCLQEGGGRREGTRGVCLQEALDQLSAASCSQPLLDESWVGRAGDGGLRPVPLPQTDIPLDDDLLMHVFMALTPRDLCQAAQVSRRWRDAAMFPGLHALSFKGAWGLACVRGSPSRLSFWHLESPRFVLRHRLRPSDTVTSVAVHYGCHPAALRRINNMMSDHAIHTRSQILVLVTDEVLRNWRDAGGGPSRARTMTGGQHAIGQQAQPATAATAGSSDGSMQRQHSTACGTLKDWLLGKACSIEYDVFAKRDVAVVMDATHRDSECAASGLAQAEAEQSEAQKAEARAKVVHLLVRAFGVDEATASYYLEQAGGDVRAASQELKGDMQWERSQRSSGQTP